MTAPIDHGVEKIDPREAQEMIAEQLNAALLDEDEAPAADGAPAAEAEEAAEEEAAQEAGFAARHVRMAEALLFAAAEPLDKATLEDRLPEGVDVDGIMDALVEEYAGRGVNVCKAAGKWSLRTAPDLAFLMEKERTDPKKLSRPALETLAIIGYHQPVTRAEIEEIRGVSVSKGTIDLLMEIGWVRLRGRRRAPGKPVTYGTTDDFLEHFGLEQVGDLPGMDELKAAGLLDARLPPGFEVPVPTAAGDDEEADDDETPEEAPEFAQDFLEEAGEASAGADSIDDEADDEIETTDE